MSEKRPVGLTILAFINFILAMTLLISVFQLITSPALLEHERTSVVIYTVLAPLITAIAMLVSGVGFLRLNYWAGFVFGLFLCAMSLSNTLVYSFLNGFQGFSTSLPNFLYSFTVMMLLNFRYKKYFPKSKDSIFVEELKAFYFSRVLKREC